MLNPNAGTSGSGEPDTSDIDQESLDELLKLSNAFNTTASHDEPTEEDPNSDNSNPNKSRKLKELREKILNNPKVKKILTKVFVAALAISIAIGSGAGIYKLGQKSVEASSPTYGASSAEASDSNYRPHTPLSAPDAEDISTDEESATTTPLPEGYLNDLETPDANIELTGIEVLDKTIDGTFTQYGNIGCYKNKSPENSPIDVGSPRKILEEMNVDPETATAEQYGRVTEYMSFSQNISAAPMAYIFDFECAQGKTYEETEASIKDLSDDEKENLTKDLKAIHDNTEYSFATGNGLVKNQHAEEDENGEVHSIFNEKDVTGKKLLCAKNTLTEPGKALDGSSVPAGTDILRYYDPDCANLNMVIYSIPNEAPIVYLFSNPQQPIDNPSIIPSGPEDPTPTPTPDPTPTPTPDPTPTPTPDKPKDSANSERIDNNIDNQANVNPGKTNAETQPRTSQPTAPTGQTEAPKTQNKPSQSAETTTPTGSNDPSKDQGRANPLPPNAVKPDTTTQPLQEEPNPGTAGEASDILADLGIN